jgi:hypothetical protein
MAEYGFPFDAVEVSSGIFDREYAAGDFTRYFFNFINNGVFPNPSTGLQVISNNNMTVTMKQGSAWALGVAYWTDEDIFVQINNPNPNYNRKDIIVVRLDLTNRVINMQYLPGEPGTNPQPPAIIRTEDIFDLQLAVITVRAGTGSVLQSDILDTRMNKEVCGLVTGLPNSVDTTTLFNQYQNYLNQKIAEWNIAQTNQAAQFESNQNTWESWFNQVQANLGQANVFDAFYNWARLPGFSYNTVFNVNGSITETITNSGDGSTFAIKTTVFNVNGTITESVSCPIILSNDVQQLTTFNTDGSIASVVITV